VTDGLARYRVDVVATAVGDVVGCAGGWIGATVNGPHVTRPDFPAPQVVSVTDDKPSDGGLVEHRLSAAARRFKAHALIAVDLPPVVDAHESSWMAGQRVKSNDVIALGADGCAPERFEAQVVPAVFLP
jgi:hypothetical protein